MSESLLSQLANLRKVFSEASPENPKVISDYAWTIVKALLQHCHEMDSLMARQLLADCLKLPIERPSKLYSTLLAAALKVSATYPEFRFAAFLRMWGITNLRPEDNERQQGSGSSADGKSFPSLKERTIRTLAHSLLLHPEDEVADELAPLLQTAGYVIRSTSSLSSSLTHPMLVTRIKEATNKEGRKFHFVTLTSPEGLEVECITNQLQSHLLHPLPEGKRHYANIGQLYDCLLKTKATVPAGSPAGITLTEAYLSQFAPTTFFPTEIGYIESIDQQHGHMHVFDSHSRHFAAPVLRFSRERVGDFVRFIPIVPAASKFKTAIIQGTVPSSSEDVQGALRDILITHINKEKGYAAWELTDKEHPITEILSPLQLSQGETSPTFTTGYLNLSTVPDGSPSGIIEGQELTAFIYLKRGKDRQKRPNIARLFP